jgi:hypothetical protein
MPYFYSKEDAEKFLVMLRNKLNNKKTKFNIMTLKYVKDKKSRYGRYFTHENCDLCQKQGVKFEVLKYNGLFDPTMIRQALPWRSEAKESVLKYMNVSLSSKWENSIYILFYTCSEECSNLLIFQQEGG